MEKNELIVLKSEIDSQISEIESIYKKIDERKNKKTEFSYEGLGLWLHNLYCAFEDLFKIVARAFENNIMDKERYHIELLKRMSIEMPGVRPALLSEDSVKLLDALRSFRHRLRHAYVYDIDPVKVDLVVSDAEELKKVYKKDIEIFIKKLG